MCGSGVWDEHYLDKVLAICLQQMRNPMYAIATNCWKLDSTRNEYEISEEVVRRFVLGIEGGIKDFFVSDMNHTLGGEVTFIASATGVFGFGSKIGPEVVIYSNITNKTKSKIFCVKKIIFHWVTKMHMIYV